MSRYIPSKIRNKVLAEQEYKCNNRPGIESKNLENFNCPLWDNKKSPGTFNEEGFDIDHIIEFSLTRDNSRENLQALCKTCHREKTKIFREKRRRESKRVIRKVVITHHDETATMPILREASKKKHVCKLCNKGFTSTTSLRYHQSQRVCLKNRIIACRYCAKYFSHHSSKSRHEKVCDRKEEYVNNKTVDERMSQLEEKILEFGKIVSELKKENIKLKKDYANVRVIKTSKNVAGRPGTKRKCIAVRRVKDDIRL